MSRIELRHVAVDDAQREALDDRRLADAGLADQHRIVLGPARQHLDRTADLLVAADDRIKLAVARGLGEVAGIFLQRVIGVLGARRIGSAPLAQVIDGGVQGLRRYADVGQNLGRLRSLLHRNGDEEALNSHEGVAGLLGDLLGIVEDARGCRREIELASSRALHLRKFIERGFGLTERLARIAARPVDEAGAKALFVVEQDLQEMLGRELLVALPERKLLRGLDETARALGVFFKIHDLPLVGASPGPEATRAARW